MTSKDIKKKKNISKVKPRVRKKSWPKWPWKMTDACVRKLEQWFRSNMSITTACAYADITSQTYYEKLRVDDEFSDKMYKAKEFFKMLVENNIASTLMDKNKEMTLKERGEFSLKVAERIMPDKYQNKRKIEDNRPVADWVGVVNIINVNLPRNWREEEKIIIVNPPKEIKKGE